MGRYRKPILILAIVLTHLTDARVVVADPTLDEARKRFEQGEAYFKAGTYDKAIEEYTAAYGLVPRSALLFNIGLCHEKSGDVASAVRYYERYLEADPNGGKAPEATARREALMRAMEQQRGDIERMRRASADRAAGKSAFGDGDYAEAIARLTASYELVPEPEVVFELAEAYRHKGNLVLAETEYQRYLKAAATGANRAEASRHIGDIEAARRRAAVTVPVVTAPARPAVSLGPRGSLRPAIIAFSAAGVAATVGMVFGLRSRSTRGDLDDQLRLGAPPLDTGDPRFAAGKRDALKANVSFGIAGVAAITGAVLTWRALQREPLPPKRGDAIATPSIGPDHAGVRVEVIW